MTSFSRKNLVLLAIAGALGALTVVLIVMTLHTAQQLEDRTQEISRNTKAVEDATASISELEETNATARQILASAQPLAIRARRLCPPSPARSTRSRARSRARPITWSAPRLADRQRRVDQRYDRDDQLRPRPGSSSAPGRSTASPMTLDETAGQLGALTGRINTIAGELTNNINLFRAPLSELDDYLEKGK